MPTPSPALDPDRGQKLLKGARPAPVGFAFGLGRTPAESVLAVDKTKAPKALFALCKKEGGASKGAYGTATFESGTVFFTCEKSDATGLDRALIAYFKANKIALKVEVTGSSEGDGEIDDDAPDEKAATSQEPMPPTDRSREEPDAPPQTEVPEDSEDPEDEGPSGPLFDPAVIVPLLRKARDQARPFAFGVGPDGDVLAVDRRMAPKRLAQKIRQQGAKRGVWGTAVLDGPIIVFTCEKEPFPGVKKGLKRWFKTQGLTVKFRVEGPEGPYADPDAAGEEQLEAELEAMMPALKAAAARSRAVKDRMRDLYAGAKAALDRADLPAATTAITELKRLSEDGAETSAPAALKAWQEARATAIDALRRLDGAIRAAKDPEADKASILLQAIMKNLSPAPADARAVAELERYLSTDDIIVEAEMPNGFGIEVKLREPLLAALAGLRETTAA